MDWQDLEFFQTDKFKKIIKHIKEDENQGKTILPTREDILNAFYYTPLEEVKCVIIGQDPYPTEKPHIHAHGLSFSVKPEIKPLPKSLINIFKELKNDVGVVKENGCLIDWAKQGVLLLNRSLTVVSGQPGSHSMIGWGMLVKDAIRAINTRKNNVVFIMWGKHAQELNIFIDQSKHFIIQSAHPSPLSASRGFFGSRPFSRTNDYLIEHNIKPIRW